MFRAIISPILRSTRLYVTACGIMHHRCCRPVTWMRLVVYIIINYLLGWLDNNFTTLFVAIFANTWLCISQYKAKWLRYVTFKASLASCIIIRLMKHHECPDIHLFLSHATCFGRQFRTSISDITTTQNVKLRTRPPIYSIIQTWNNYVYTKE